MKLCSFLKEPLRHSLEKDDLLPEAILKLILRHLFEFFLIKKKMEMEIFPEVICRLV